MTSAKQPTVAELQALLTPPSLEDRLRALVELWRARNEEAVTWVGVYRKHGQEKAAERRDGESAALWQCMCDLERLLDAMEKEQG